MENDGIVSMPRAWLDRAITTQPDFLRAVAYLALQINENGSVNFSSGDAYAMFGMSARRYRTFMSLITNDKQTDKQTTNKTTSIKFVYQAVATTKRQAKRQTNDKQTDKQTTKFIPPTDRDVEEYAREKGLHFDPLSFVPFYESKGWKVGDQPMKDWKAACRTWEQRWKEKHGTIFYYELKNGNNQPTRTADGRKVDQYSALEDAAKAILCRPANFGASQYD